MMRRLLLFFVFVMLGVSIMTAQSNMKIADFETGVTSAGLKIGTYSDKPMNGTSIIKAKLSEGATGHGKAIDLAGSITTDYPYGFAGLHVPLTKSEGETVDVSGYTGLRFTTRGDGQSYMIVLITASVKDFDDFNYSFKPSTEWSTVDVPFKKLKQMGFGAPMKWSGKDLKAIRFQIQTFGPPIAQYKFSVDDLEFY